jgi:uncharacterized protein (TIGR01777 family)
MKIVITGGTGFIGKSLVERLLSRGDTVVVLTTRNVPASGKRNLIYERWEGTLSESWSKHVDGADAVITLAGENLSRKRWSARQKEILRQSRIGTTRSVVAAIGSAKKKPSVLVSASGAGYYGHVVDGDVTEDAPKGTGFLADLCGDWEAEAMKAAASGVRVVTLRMGVVLGSQGGALKKMLLPFRLFAGGTLGTGRQWFPWIHLEDEIGFILYAIGQAEISGPVNLAAPEPATMAQFCKSLGKAMHRPSWAPVPGVVLKLALGEMAEMILTGQRMVPKRVVEAGYVFRYPTLEDALGEIF